MASRLASAHAALRLRLICGVLFLVIFGWAPTGDAWAKSGGRHINVDSRGYAIARYDPVAYFTEGRPVRGTTRFTAEFDGAKYAFSSDSNRKLFIADPAKYAPQYGGYCAYGVVYGSKSDIDPEVWEIVDGRLYFMINPSTMSLWKKRTKIHIRIADKAWKSITTPN